MPKWWPFNKEILETNDSVSLNEQQLNILDTVIPGFKRMDENHQGIILEKTIPGFTNSKDFVERLQNAKNEMESYYTLAAYGALYTKISSHRSGLIKDIEKARQFYLVDVMISQLADDALSPDTSSGNIINIWSDNPKINKEINYLDSKFKFDDMISDITPDLAAYGEYILKTEIKKGEGIVDLLDNVEQDKVVAVTKFSRIDKYIVDDLGKIEIKKPSEYVKFTLGNQRMRIDLFEDFGMNNRRAEELKDIPRFVRMGKSVIYPVLSKIKELELLEQLVPASKLSKLSSGSIIGVQVPTGTDLVKAVDAVRKIEGVINKKIGVDITKKEMTLENIMSTAGRVKVVPLFGDKGRLEKMEYKSDEPDDLLSSVRDIREVICTSVGIPYELLFSSDGESKGEMLRKHARYFRKLKTIQKAIINGIKQILIIHLVNKGVSVKDDDIKIAFANPLIDVVELDRLEFVDASIAYMDNIKRFVFELADEDESPFKENVNMKEFIIHVHKVFKSIGMGAVIDIDEEPDKEADINNNSDDEEDSKDEE